MYCTSVSFHVRLKPKLFAANITFKLFLLTVIEKTKVDPTPVFDQHILEAKLFTTNITFKYFLILRSRKVFLQTMISCKFRDIDLDVMRRRHHFPLRMFRLQYFQFLSNHSTQDTFVEFLSTFYHFHSSISQITFFLFTENLAVAPPLVHFSIIQCSGHCRRTQIELGGCLFYAATFSTEITKYYYQKHFIFKLLTLLTWL